MEGRPSRSRAQEIFQIPSYELSPYLSPLNRIKGNGVDSQKAIVNFLEAEHVLSAHQSGFRRRLGADDLLTALQHHWATTAGNGDFVHVLATDIAGAFDKVSHRGVLYKASTSGIVGPVHRWLQLSLRPHATPIFFISN